jgi:DNA-binding CsgD family transcriptional regulator
MPLSTRADVLALAVSRLHRSVSIDALRRSFLEIAPAFVDADVFGLYLLDARQRPVAIYAKHAARAFLSAYEPLRSCDPCFRTVAGRQRFAHTHAVIAEPEWIRHPLCRLMSQWGLRYSIEAPLTVDGDLRGTINFARRDRGYFDAQSLARAQFLCAETAFVFERLTRERHRDSAAGGVAEPQPALSRRTHAAAALAASGLSNRSIATRLGVSENTIRDHLRRAYVALGVHNRAQLARRLR